MRNLSVSLVLVGLLSACTILPVTPGSDKVVLLPANFVEHCQLLGQTNVSVLERVGILERSPEYVEKDLAALARNDAVSMKGDAVVAQTPVKAGKQTYRIYKCGK